VAGLYGKSVAEMMQLLGERGVSTSADDLAENPETL
jgi:hypothetical protein